MPEPPDVLARAYATLQLPYGCSRRDAARQYKRLAKRWHPDQYAYDPQGQAEAAQRMREINRAFAVVSQAARDAMPRGAGRHTSTEAARPAVSARVFGHRLSEVDLREISESIREPSMAGVLGRYVMWGGCLGFGFILVAQPGRPRSAMHSVAGVLLLGAAATYRIYTLWSRNR